MLKVVLMKRMIPALLMVMMLVTACGGLAPVPTPVRKRTATPAPPTLPPTVPPTAVLWPTATATPAATATLTATPTPAVVECVNAQVTRVVDGNSLEVKIGNKTSKVRYLGLNAPGPTERMGKDALAANKTLVEGKTVCLEKDVTETDKSGALLRYVYVDDLLANVELVRLGMAQVTLAPPDTKYQTLLLEAQQEAYVAGRGLWGGTPGTGTPSSATGTPRTAVGTRTPTPRVGRGTHTPEGTPIAEAPQELLTLTTPTQRGAVAAVTVRTLPNVACTAAIYFPGRPDIRTVVSGKNGICSWSWNVYSNIPAGTYLVVVTTGNTTREYWLEVQ